MKIPQVKICGLTDPESAYSAAVLGADYIGVVLHPQSKRFVSIAKARLIAEAAIKGGAIPVAVCVNQTADEIIAICVQTGIQMVQLHGDEARQAHTSLPDTLGRIYVLSVDSNGEIMQRDLSGLNFDRDFILYDGQNPGSGVPINLDQIESHVVGRFFIAGGITVENVSSVIARIKPDAVDVSTGVESYPGKKDKAKMQQFISMVKKSEMSL